MATNSGKSKQPRKSSGNGPATTSATASAAQLRELHTAVATLSDRLATLTESLAEPRLRTAIDERLSQTLDKASTRAEERVLASTTRLLEADDTARRRSLAAIDDLVGQLKERVANAEALATATDDRVAQPRLEALVERAVTERARELVQPTLDGLSESYERIDDRLDRLKAFLEEFGPGGAPALRQSRDAWEEQAGRLQAELEAARADAAEQRARAEELDAERLERRARSGLSLEQLDVRLNELQERDRDLAARTALASENTRLQLEVKGLQQSLNEWRSRGEDQEIAKVELARMRALEREVGEAEQSQARLENEKRKLSRKLRSAEEQVRQLSEEREAAIAENLAREERQRRIETLSEELSAATKAIEVSQTDASLLRAELLSLRLNRDQLTDELGRLNDRFKSAEQAWRVAAEAAQAQVLAQKTEDLNQWAEHHADILAAEHRARSASLETQLDAARATVEDLRAKLETEKSKCIEAHSTLEAERVRHGALQAEIEMQRVRLEAQATEALNRREALLEEHAARVRIEAAQEGERQREAAEQEANRLTELADAEERRYNELLDEQQAAQSALSSLEGRKGVLEEQIELLRQGVEDLRERTLPREERISSLFEPVFSRASLAEVSQPHSEKEWLGGLHASIKAAGFTFHQRLLNAFHTSLKIAEHAPLVVLAGISGTGKSQLPRLYADLGGLPFLPLSVQPSWDSPHDLFGFFNYTDGRLKAEPLARLLRQVGDEDDPLRQSPALILLDEMNLARVEYYFAELLSKLEARRGLPEDATAEQRLRASVEIDVGPGEPTMPLFLDPRLLIVGTMNDDESTLTLSDKVLDRACVLTFPAPHGMKLQKQPPTPPSPTRLDWSTWRSWIRSSADVTATEKLNRINEVMDRLGRPFGHRLFRAIHAYLDNHPEGAESPDAWSDQFAMKIIPRLRGLECDAAAVRSDLETLAEHVPEDLKASFDRARGREFFAWSGASELYRVDG